MSARICASQRYCIDYEDNRLRYYVCTFDGKIGVLSFLSVSSCFHTIFADYVYHVKLSLFYRDTEMTTLAYYRLWGRNLAFKPKSGFQMTTQETIMLMAGTTYNSLEVPEKKKVNKIFEGMYTGY